MTQSPSTPTAEDEPKFALQANSDTNNGEPWLLFVNSASIESVRAARVEIEDLLIKSKRSVPMPDTYSQALKQILAMREEASSEEIATRIKQVFVPTRTLPEKLQIEPKLCRIILRTLHDLGDLLWYENLDVGMFRDTIIMDPMLLIDYIRQVINHKYTGQTISHTELISKRYWMELDDPQLVKAMKQVMQQFHLVYSAHEDRTMKWDSHLIVPAFWQTKPPASWKFLGQDLRVQIPDAKIEVRTCWEYQFPFGLPFGLFDYIVVDSVSPFAKFDAGPDWILYNGKEGTTACRLMVNRDRRSRHQTIQVETLIAEVATDKQVKTLWRVFQNLVEALIGVLGEYKGLPVSCIARDEEDQEHELKSLLATTKVPDGLAWMPPSHIWKNLQFRQTEFEFEQEPQSRDSQAKSNGGASLEPSQC